MLKAVPLTPSAAVRDERTLIAEAARGDRTAARELYDAHVERVHRIVSTIGLDDGYSIVFDAADGNIVFGDKSLDLTDRVLSGLAQEDQGIAPKPK